MLSMHNDTGKSLLHQFQTLSVYTTYNPASPICIFFLIFSRVASIIIPLPLTQFNLLLSDYRIMGTLTRENKMSANLGIFISLYYRVM